MIEVKVKNIGLDSLTGSPILMLADVKNEDDIYPIWIGVSEAEGIILKQSEVETPRPLTYDLMKNIIQSLGGKIEKIAIVDQRDNAYIAEITIKKDGKEIIIDARPSDAVNLALRFDAPIYLNENVVKKVNIKEIKSEDPEGNVVNNDEESERVDPEMEEFKKLLENIKPEDFAIENKKDKKERS